MSTVIHNIPPVYDNNSEILILGSFPSVASRDSGFYYGHKNNRFWKVLSHLYKVSAGESSEAKKHFLLSHRIALWDVVRSCDVFGSSDGSIKNVTANDIKFIISSSKVSRIYTNGKTAERLYKKYVFPAVGINSTCLPSTSPANAAYSFEKLCREWKIILD